VFVHRRPIVSAFLFVNENARRVGTKYSLGPLNKIDAVVGSRRTDVMLQHDRTSFDGLDETSVVVATLVALFPFGVIRRYMLLAIRFQPEMRRAHRDEVIKFVTAVYAHILGHGTKTMRWIKITVAQSVVSTPPESFVRVFKQDAT